jgi:DNA-directed RNA polymerase subunit RPC12/RpoP
MVVKCPHCKEEIDSQIISFYPACPFCKKGTLLPFFFGKTNFYACTYCEREFGSVGNEIISHPKYRVRWFVPVITVADPKGEEVCEISNEKKPIDDDSRLSND